MNSSSVVMERLSKEGPSSSAYATRQWLEEAKVQPVAEVPASVTASEALRLWRTRLKNLEFTKQTIEGLPDLIRGLENLAPQRKVEQFGFIGKTSVATIFFDRSKGRFIGSAIVKHRS